MPWTGKTLATALSDAALATIATIAIEEGAAVLSFEVATSDVGGLGGFEVAVSPHVDASYTVVASIDSDYTTDIDDPIISASSDFTALDSDSTGVGMVLVRSLYGVRLQAKAATGKTTSVDVRWRTR